MIDRHDSDIPMFTGSIDDLLKHSMTIDPEMVEQKVKDNEKRMCIEHIMQECDCDAYEAEKIYNEISLSEVKQTVDAMVAEGILEITGHNEDGEPLFGLTELGKELQKQSKKP